MAVTRIQAQDTAINIQAGHQSISPADQNRVPHMKRTPMVSRMAKRAMSFLSKWPRLPQGAANVAVDRRGKARPIEQLAGLQFLCSSPIGHSVWAKTMRPVGRSTRATSATSAGLLGMHSRVSTDITISSDASGKERESTNFS